MTFQKPDGNKYRVFTDSGSFFDQLKRDFRNAQRSIYIQCMSFEADSVGRELIELLQSKPELDRILMVDNYSKYVVNDTFVFGPAGIVNSNNALTERIALNDLVKKAKDSGIQVKFTNPVGPFFLKYPRRNHKKMVIVDEDLAYLGGMNFTEHNFRWTDLMVRHADPELCRVLKISYKGDFEDSRKAAVHDINDRTRVIIHDGFRTRKAFDEILRLISAADKVVAISPYISYPVLDAVSEVADNLVVLPQQNNKFYAQWVHSMNRYENINFQYVGGEMMHMKMLILDESTVIYGSSNFDTISYFFEKEIILKSDDQHLVNRLSEIAAGLIN